MSPLIVAEMSASHLGSLERALQIVDAAKEAGANCVKLQTWHADGMTVCETPLPSGPWAGRSMTDLYRECRTPWEWHATIFDHCRKLGMLCFSAPFDEKSIEFLETLGCPIYKIASPEITHLELIRAAASKGKPLVISTGMATEEEIEAAVETATKAGAAGLTLLKCVSAYPAPLEGFDLMTMAHMAERFGCLVGLSDHTLTTTAAVAATALGASIIERHLSLDREGPDGAFASMPSEFEEMVRAVRAAATVVGGVRYGPNEAERDSLQYRRSLWVVNDISENEVITRDNVAVLRPSGGMEPARLESTLGMRASVALKRGTALTYDVVR